MKLKNKTNRQPNLIVNAATKDQPPEILIYDDIGPDWLGMIGAQTIAKALKDVGETEQIVVRLNSPGGSVFEGIAIYNQLKNHKAQITMEIDGLAASIASIIAMAGDSVRIAGNAMMMIHDPMMIAFGNAVELQKKVDLLKDVKDNMLLPTYAARTGEKASAEELAQLMTEETWLSANESVEKGLADSISENKAVTAHVDGDVYNYKHIPEQFTNARPDEPEEDEAGEAEGEETESADAVQVTDAVKINIARRRLKLAAMTGD